MILQEVVGREPDEDNSHVGNNAIVNQNVQNYPDDSVNLSHTIQDHDDRNGEQASTKLQKQLLETY